MIIRPAHVGDEERLARVYVDTWKATYRGLLAQALLDALNYRDVAVQWVRTFEHRTAKVFVAQSEHAEIAGFVTAGKVSDTTSGFDAEVYTLYVLPGFQRQGVGNRLLRAAVDALEADGYGSLVIWVLKGNSAEEFYRKMGGVPAGEKTTVLDGAPYQEIAFGWSDIETVGRDPFPLTQSWNFH